MIAGAAPARRRGARAALCAAVTLGGVAAVLMVAGREPASRPVASGEAPVASALPVPVAAESQVRSSVSVTPRPPWQVPVVTRPRRDDAAPAPERSDSPSFDDDDWRDRVAAVLGRQAVEGAPLNPGSVHTHLPPAGVTATPDARPPTVLMGSAPPGTQGMEGWDGGVFWFGPNGLVRVKEAQR